MKNAKTLAILAVVGAALLGTTVLQARGPAGAGPAAAPSAPPFAPPRGPVAAEGRVVAYPGAEVKVGAERAGRLVRVAVQEGQAVRRASCSPSSSRTSCGRRSPRRAPAWPRPKPRSASRS